MNAVYGLPATQTFYGSSINVPVNAYADPNTFTGPDTNTNLDADDEVAFMARDAGGPAGTLANPAGTTGTRAEVKLTEPGNAAQTGYVYLFAGNGTLDPGAGKRYVDYQFRLNSGEYKATYKRTDGPNPENSTVTGSTYTAHYADRWTMDAFAMRQGSKPGVDLIDRVKYDIQLFCVRNENTFNEEEGAFVVNKSGPVRAIRSWVGANSGPNTQNTQVFYDTSFVTTINLRVHAIPNVGAHLLTPLAVMVNGVGEPTPTPACVRATNSAHVTAGRATAFLFWAFAVGSGNYLGLITDTTSLRETSPGVWTLVTAC
jgi:hypothetical protein